MSKPPIDLQTQPKSDFRAALTRVGTVVVLGVLPVAALITMFVVGLTGGPLSGDFHYELYPQAKILLHGDNPFPPADWDPLAQSNLIWPPAAAFLVSP